MEIIGASGLLGMLVIMAAVITIALIFNLDSINRTRLNNGSRDRNAKGTTYFLDEGEDGKKCEICYGKILEDDVALCLCGKLFHEACARPTGTCPYCGSEYGAMEVRRPIRARCPICGRFVSGNMCACGAVLPRKDNTFLCSCGNRVDVGKPVCRRCGAVYENMTAKPIERK